ncbi:putative aminopeptidase-2 [Aphelenchoides besseyi]|nr:putative aminopeptidase-2 [Aphelenchoides besseyi]
MIQFVEPKSRLFNTMVLLKFCVVLYLLSNIGHSFEDEPESPLHAHYQLPRVVKVNLYELTLEPFFPFPSVTGRQDLTFDGHVKINFTIIKSTQSVWLNSEKLSIQTLRLYDENKLMAIDAFTLDPIKNQIKLTPVEFFEVGRSYRLEVEYTGDLSTTQDGGFFYFTYNSTVTGKLNTVLSTVFEPALARKMVPSFDDPHFKASFKMTAIIPNGALAFHTTQIENSLILKNGKKQVTFKQTPPMSTYLVSLSVGDFAIKSSQTKRNIKTQSIVLPELEPFIGDTPQKSANCIDAFELLVGVDYPLQKLDNIDTIDFFHGGGIENFGAILFTKVLANLQSAMSPTDDLDIYSIMCHETAHQWTGDYVTTNQWGSVFLNEAFADYFSYRMLQTMPNADYKYLESAFLRSRQYGFLESKRLNHSIASNQSNFDEVTYGSGSSVVRQLEGILGRSRFMQGIISYLNAHKFGTVTLEDLESSLQSVAPTTLCSTLTLTQISHDYFTQLYYPIVTVDIVNGFYVLQQHTIYSSTDKWNIPLFVQDVTSGKSYTIYLLKNGEICNPQGPSQLSATNPLIFNREGLSYTIVTYSDTAWKKLFDLNFTKVDERTLLALLTDELDQNAKKRGRANNLITRLLSDFNGKLPPHLVQVSLEGASKRKLTHSILESVYPHVDWTATTLREGALAEVVTPLAVQLNIGDARAKATALFGQFSTACSTLKDLETCNPINPTVRAAAYCAGTLNPDKSMRDFLSQYKKSMDIDNHFYFQYEYYRVNNGLNCQSHNPNRYRSYLKAKATRRQAKLISY